jgi:hypothetical protein
MGRGKERSTGRKWPFSYGGMEPAGTVGPSFASDSGDGGRGVAGDVGALGHAVCAGWAALDCAGEAVRALLL